LLARLHGAGWTLGVATGKSDRGLHGCLTMHGIFDLFVTLQTADRTRRSRTRRCSRRRWPRPGASPATR
jgi:phosphoglycolate phosphatase-like HAD superfamily hydrolase